MQTHRTVMLLAAGLLASAFALADDVELGADLYAESCARCHGDEADGLRTFALAEPDFVARLEGLTREMPDFTGYFDDDEVAALYVYLNARARAYSEDNP